MSDNFQESWNKCLQAIKDNVGEAMFRDWFACARPVSFENNEIILALPSLFFKEQYETRFYNLISSTLRRFFGPSVHLSYSIDIVSDDSFSKVQISSVPQSGIAINKTVTATQGPATPFAEEQYDDIDPQLNPAYNFANYCVGQSNHLPFVIADFISKNPHKTEFNPFFLYGSVGVGKTHLIQAIGLRIKEQNPRMRVLYVTYRQFQNQYSSATMKKCIPDFINWYEQVDVLLIDDLQEITSGTSNVLFPIFNHLHQRGRQLIFTSDRAPQEIDGVADRLIDRFKWGVVEKLEKPDLELRKKILHFKAEHNGLSLPDEVIDLIAEYADGSVRELEGIVMGILTHSIANNAPITVELAREVMSHTVKVERRSVNFDMIVEATAEFYKLNPDVIFSKSRVRDIADARQLIMYLTNKHTNLSSSAIGAKLNRRHATVLYGIKTVAERLPFSKELTEAVASIEADLKHM